MPTIKKILVCFDASPGSYEALELAKHLSCLNAQIEVDLLTVIGTQLMYTEYAASSLSIDKEILVNKYESHAYDVLNKVKRELEPQIPNPVNCHIAQGNPVKRILDFARTNKTDLIVIGSRGHGSVKEFILGSVSHHVVQKAPCSVLLAK